MMAVEVRLLEDNQAELANNFFNQVYNTNRSIENFRWEFFEGPNGKAIYVIAVDTAETNFQKIVGIQCAIPIEFTNADGKRILTAKSEDTLVHPEYRGQKLFERMYALLFEECKNAGIEYIWGFTPALKAFERIGFEAPFKTTQALLVLKPAKAFLHLTKLNSKNKLSDKFKIFGLTVVSLCVGLKRFTTTVSKNTLAQTNVNDKEAIFFSYYKQTPYYFLRQSEGYLNWRISKNPFGNGYKNLRFGDPLNPVADIIINIRAEVSYIEQILFSPVLTNSEKLQILNKTLAVITQNGVSSVRVLCFENNETMLEQIALLKKLGFIYLKRGDHFVWKKLQVENPISIEQILFSRLFTQGNK